MPHYRQNEYIKEAWESVRGEVERLLVVDDGSDPPTAMADICLPENMGAAYAINTGIRTLLHSPGILPDWLTWVSSDNIYRPKWAQKLVAAADEQTGAVYGGFTWQKPGQAGRYLFKPYDPARLIQDENCYFGPVFLIRTEVWREAGPHRGKISHDYDHWLRVEEVCWKKGLKIVGVDEDLCWYRAHDKRATVLKAKEYDATHWQAEARKRRGIA